MAKTLQRYHCVSHGYAYNTSSTQLQSITDGLISTIKGRLTSCIDCKHYEWHAAPRKRRGALSCVRWDFIFTSRWFELSDLLACKVERERVSARAGDRPTSANSAHQCRCGWWFAECEEKRAFERDVRQKHGWSASSLSAQWRQGIILEKHYTSLHVYVRRCRSPGCRLV